MLHTAPSKGSQVSHSEIVKTFQVGWVGVGRGNRFGVGWEVSGKKKLGKGEGGYGLEHFRKPLKKSGGKGKKLWRER